MLGDLGKLIITEGFKKLPKVQKIARSGHTGYGVANAYGPSISRQEVFIKLSFKFYL